MMISAASGFINQSIKYSRENAGKSLKKYTLLKQGELAYNHGASKLRNFGCCFELEEKEARIPYVYHTFSINEKQYTHYIAKYLNNPLIDKQLKKLVTSSVRMDGLLNISYNEYMGIRLNIPNYSEQEKVSKFLTLIDKKIQLQQQLIENLKLYKRGLVKQIFSYKCNDSYKLNDILSEHIERCNGKENLKIISSTKQGLYYQEDYFNKQAASSNTTGYKILKRDQIVFSPQNLWMGNINFNDKYEIGIVSPSYKIYNINSKFNKYYIAYLLKSPKAIKEYILSSEQGASIVRRNLNIDLFNQISFKIPDINIQNKHANTLYYFDKFIENNENKSIISQNMKIALLQQMFI